MLNGLPRFPSSPGNCTLLPLKKVAWPGVVATPPHAMTMKMAGDKTNKQIATKDGSLLRRSI
jgi:hypothetical protein